MYGLIPVGLPDQRGLMLPIFGRKICVFHAKTRWIIDCARTDDCLPKRIRFTFINEGNSDAQVIPVGPLPRSMNEVTSACLWMASKLSMLITLLFYVIAAWRNWQKRG